MPATPSFPLSFPTSLLSQLHPFLLPSILLPFLPSSPPFYLLFPPFLLYYPLSLPSQVILLSFLSSFSTSVYSTSHFLKNLLILTSLPSFLFSFPFLIAASFPPYILPLIHSYIPPLLSFLFSHLDCFFFFSCLSFPPPLLIYCHICISFPTGFLWPHSHKGLC